MKRNFKKNNQCKRFRISLKAKIKFKNISHNIYYRKFIKKYDFVNKRISRKIYKSFKTKFKSF